MKLPVIKVARKGEDVLVNITPPPGKKRTPCELVCVVDVSGSMGDEATMKSTSGDTERFGLSILDIVKHACKTIIHCLNENDKLSLVTFASKGKVIFELKAMDEKGRKDALKDLDSLKPEDATNLWDGLYKGLEVLKKSSKASKSAVRTVLLFTDGQPNVIPPKGHLAMLQQYKDKNQELVCTVNTFGFGYSLDSKVLEELAVEGNGMYAFIPDSSFTGTVFVNALSNMLSTLSTTTTVTLEHSNGAKVEKCRGGYPYQGSSWGIQVHPGPLRYGQCKDILLKMSIPKELENDKEFLTVTLTYQPPGSDPIKIELEAKLADMKKEEEKQVAIQLCRNQLVEVIGNVVVTARGDGRWCPPECPKMVKEMLKKIAGSKFKKDDYVKDLLTDLSGQVSEAVSRQDWYAKWGRHYLPSLQRAHLLQECNNFKDPGVQHYGGKLFDELREEAETIFQKLPPPTPTADRTERQAALTKKKQEKDEKQKKRKAKARPAVRSMERFYSSYNPCFSGDCEAECVSKDGKKYTKLVSELRRGDLVTSNDDVAKIICVVQTVCEDSKAWLVEFSTGLKITPYHPMQDAEGEWKFPISVEGGKLKNVDCESVYSFVLENGKSEMNVNSHHVVSLGHGLDQNEVVKHEYYGTEKVVEDLKEMKGFYEKGMVKLRTGCVIRDEKTGIVKKLYDNFESNA